MQIARGGGRNSTSSPESINHVNFLEASDESQANIVDDVLNRVAEYVEPAASRTTEIIDALNRVVVGENEIVDKKPKRKSFMDALNQASSKNDETLSVTDLDTAVTEKPRTRFDFTAKDILKLLDQSLKKSSSDKSGEEDGEEENSNPLPTTSQYVEPTYAEILASVYSLIDTMEASIHRFELTGTAQSLPDSPRQLCDRNEMKSKTEQLLHRLQNKSPIHKRQERRTDKTSIPPVSEKLIAKLTLQIDRLRKNRTGTVDESGNDTLDSARDQKPVVSENKTEAVSKGVGSTTPPNTSPAVRPNIPDVISPMEEQPRSTYQRRETIEPPLRPREVEVSRKIDESVVIEASKQLLRAEVLMKTDQEDLKKEAEGGLGLTLPPKSPELIDLGTEVAGPSDVSSIEDELFFASSKDTAKKGRRMPWKMNKDATKDMNASSKLKDDSKDRRGDGGGMNNGGINDNGAESRQTIPDMSPSRSRALSPKHYCVKCSRLLSYSPRRIRDDVLARLVGEEAIKWRRCQACIERMFPSLFDPFLRRIVDNEGLISFEDGELLFELSGRAEIPIRWNHKGDKKEFVSVLHLVLFELATNKDVVMKVASGADLYNLLEKESIKVVENADSRITSVLKSVCQLQVDQHPLLAHLLTKYHKIKLHVSDALETDVDILWLSPTIGSVWCEIVGSMAHSQADREGQQG